MVRTIKTTLVVLGIFTVLTGLVYPLFITGVVQLLFPEQANGSIIEATDGTATGSTLIGQPFSDPQYFWGRPSATSGGPYNASSSGGSNYSVLSETLEKQVRERIEALQIVDPDNAQPIPVDLVTASASGLDPHISPAAAYYQVPRIARVRNFSEEQVRELVDESIESPLLGFIGEPRVNVLMINLALDSLQ